MLLDSYQSPVSTTISAVTRGTPAGEHGRARNKQFLTFFYPFWAEHVLALGRLDAAAVTAAVDKILAAPVPP